MFKRIPLPAIVGIALMFIALVAFFMATSAFQQKTSIMVAGSDLAPFVRADSSLQAVAVPKASVTSNDLTQSDYRKDYADKNIPVIPVIQFLKGQRLDKNAIAVNAQASFASVLPDERVISVSATLTGSVLGTPGPGDVVDVEAVGSASDGSSISSQFDKVLCVTDKATGCKNVVPASAVTSSTKTSGGLGSGGTASLFMLLAVPTADALQLAGQQVAVSLNPFCKVGPAGRFYSVQQSQPCSAPQGRIASTPAPASATAPATPGGSAQTTTTTSTTTTTGH